METPDDSFLSTQVGGSVLQEQAYESSEPRSDQPATSEFPFAPSRSTQEAGATGALFFPRTPPRQVPHQNSQSDNRRNATATLTAASSPPQDLTPHYSYVMYMQALEVDASVTSHPTKYPAWDPNFLIRPRGPPYRSVFTELKTELYRKPQFPRFPDTENCPIEKYYMGLIDGMVENPFFVRDTLEELCHLAELMTWWTWLDDKPFPGIKPSRVQPRQRRVFSNPLPPSQQM